MKIDSFQGELIDVSAKKEALLTTRVRTAATATNDDVLDLPREAHS